MLYLLHIHIVAAQQKSFLVVTWHLSEKWKILAKKNVQHAWQYECLVNTKINHATFKETLNTILSGSNTHLSDSIRNNKK